MASSESTVEAIPSPTSSSIPFKIVYVSPSVTPTLIANVKGTTTQKQLSPDAPVHCKVDAKCGGGTTPLTQSECEKAVCCQIGDKWTLYKDPGLCKTDQLKQAGYPINTSGKFVPVSLSYGQTVQCAEESVQALRDANRAYDETQGKRSNCMNEIYKDNTKSCTSLCTSISNLCYGNCNSDQTCRERCSSEHSSCLAKCYTSEAEADNRGTEICDGYTKYQQENLNNLIKRYCKN